MDDTFTSTSKTKKLTEIVMDKVIEEGPSMVWSEISGVLSAESELRSLNATRTRIEALLRDAEERRHIEDDSVLGWLRELKAILFDVQDLDDEFAATQTIAEIHGSRKRKRSLLSFGSGVHARRHQPDRVVFRRGEATRRVPPSGGGGVAFHSPPEASLQEGGINANAAIYGREKELEEIIKFLTADHGGSSSLCWDLPVVSVLGPGGIGKTCLARSAFRDVENHFNLRIWLGCSPMGMGFKFDLVEATRQILEATGNKPCRLSSFDWMQCRLKQVVSNKKFLLVLDNVWSESAQFWERLSIPLTYGADGSRILITTRSRRVSTNMRSVHEVPLEGLANEHSWLLFQDTAFSAATDRAGVLKERQELERIGMEIVKRCRGLPLAVKSVGRILYSVTDEDRWDYVLTDMQEDEAVVGNVIPTLKVTYDHLPLHLKRCFAFCAIFPDGYEFDKDELVRQWIAVGFIKPVGRRRRRLEDIGNNYFTSLLWRSFFQTSDVYQKDKQKYKMPGMMHDLARFVSKFETIRVDGDVVEDAGTGTARYGCLNNLEPATLSKVYRNEGLRTLLLRGDNSVLTGQLFSELCEKFIFLQVLDLRNAELEELPASIENLILLRYLNLHNAQIASVPESLGNLCNLQTLDLGKCHELTELPDSIGDLKKLRYLSLYQTNIEMLPESVSNLCHLHTLELGECYKLQELPEDLSELISLQHLGLHLDWNVWNREMDPLVMPPGIGRLTRLRTLSRYSAGKNRGSRLGELKDLSLRGELCVSKLENVSVSDAKEANLRSKRYIDTIMFHWSKNACANSQIEGDVEQVIEWLRPHENLKHLWIENYYGTIFPGWLEDFSFAKLETLRLSGCRRCVALPCVRELLQLRTLCLESLHGVQNIDHLFSDNNGVMGFALLEKLSLIDVPHVEKLKVGGDHLSELIISFCPKLNEVSYLPPTIVKLEITNCPQLNWDTFPHLPILQKLVVENSENAIRKIETFSSLFSLSLGRVTLPADWVPQGLASLCQLKIQECQEFESWDRNESTEHLASLEFLDISSCSKFLSFPKVGLPTTLKELRLSKCPILKTWPHNLNTLNSLHVLEIHGVPGLTFIPTLPKSVNFLAISECAILQKRCQKDAADWPMIQWIPNMNIEPVSSWFKTMINAITSKIGS